MKTRLLVAGVLPELAKSEVDGREDWRSVLVDPAVDTRVADIVWRMALCGTGFGLFQSPNLNALMSSAPPAVLGRSIPSLTAPEPLSEASAFR